MGHHSNTVEEGSLRHMLKTNTKAIHDIADDAMRAFLFDETRPVSLPAYRHFLLQLYVLYDAMETELERNKDNPVVGPIHFPQELNRLKYLEIDLDYYYSKQWRDILEKNTTPGMKKYVARIKEIGRSNPDLLVAHSYTRYLGDMSGGQILKKMIIKRYNLCDENGTKFYCFDHIESIGKFKELYSARMNSLELSDHQKNAMVEEAKHIFQFNIDVFQEVGDRFLPGSNFDEGLVNMPSCSSDTHHGFFLDPENWEGSIIKMASVTVGVSAVMLALCPWFRGLLFKQIN